MNKYYQQINKALLSYENHKPYHDKTMDWICNRIDWCFKWRKITEEEMTELVNRAVNILKE